MPGGSPSAHELLCSEGEMSARTDRRVRNYGRLTKQLSLLRCHCFMIVFLSLRLSRMLAFDVGSSLAGSNVRVFWADFPQLGINRNLPSKFDA